MTMETKKNIFKEHLREWLAAKGDKKKRGEMAKNISFAAKVHPKSVPRSFRRVQMHDAGTPEQRGRHVVYGPNVTAALKDVWETASQPCGENLHGQIAEYAAILKRDGMWSHDEETTEQLLEMSLGLVKLCLGKF